MALVVMLVPPPLVSLLLMGFAELEWYQLRPGFGRLAARDIA